ncbi:hypothetical protein Smar_1541 [Staphylothermus marinus F1]|uniref:Uncharacterized protein n=1 Tax=Staphylothermus marinus (strain ATCC 43588 / DSM 3639 / JCM 9404 / F1) TaxID=399550 RepID=A3DPR7_STAMF|nr:hypothetical protein [Staphylothermus marinus]ABN70627.1 hypothetical protein Smar_1541 [Staphylothermus marinus F1]
MKSNSVIIYTGCYGLNDDILANIFLSKGAYAYLSFKGGVTWSFGDKVLEVIAKRLANGEDIVKIYKSLDKTLLKDPNSDATLGIRYRK